MPTRVLTLWFSSRITDSHHTTLPAYCTAVSSRDRAVCNMSYDETLFERTGYDFGLSQRFIRIFLIAFGAPIQLSFVKYLLQCLPSPLTIFFLYYFIFLICTICFVERAYQRNGGYYNYGVIDAIFFHWLRICQSSVRVRVFIIILMVVWFSSFIAQ